MLEKKELRKQLLEIRGSIAIEDISEKSRIITEELLSLDEVIEAETIMIYMSFRNEVDTKGLFKELIKRGKRVVAGRCIKSTREIIPVIVDGMESFEDGNYGILEPSLDNDRVNIEDIDVVIVPGVGFDRTLNRIGFGAGYYDRFLSKLRPDSKKIAICYDEQIVSKVPTGRYDLKMDMVITDKEVII